MDTPCSYDLRVIIEYTFVWPLLSAEFAAEAIDEPSSSQDHLAVCSFACYNEVKQ